MHQFKATIKNKPELEKVTLKLYMPMTATYYDEDDPEQDITMDSREAAQYAPQIINALRSERRWLENEGPEEAERGLMAYFDGPDSVDQKVQSCFFTAEVRDCQRQSEIVRKRRRNFVVFRQKGGVTKSSVSLVK